jgi:hypothetical protein
VAACQTLAEEKYYYGIFADQKVNFEERPVSILSKRGVDVCLMVQYGPNFDFHHPLSIEMREIMREIW